MIGWLAGNILYGLVIGMGVGMLLLMGAAVKAIRVAAGAPSQAAVGESLKQREIRQTAATEKRRLERRNENLQEEVEQLTAERDELLERLQAQNESLQLFSKRVNPSEKGALSIQSVQQA